MPKYEKSSKITKTKAKLNTLLLTGIKFGKKRTRKKTYSLLLNLTQLIIYFRFFSVVCMYTYINITHIQKVIKIVLSRERKKEIKDKSKAY